MPALEPGREALDDGDVQLSRRPLRIPGQQAASTLAVELTAGLLQAQLEAAMDASKVALADVQKMQKEDEEMEHSKDEMNEDDTKTTSELALRVEGVIRDVMDDFKMGASFSLCSLLEHEKHDDIYMGLRSVRYTRKMIL